MSNCADPQDRHELTFYTYGGKWPGGSGAEALLLVFDARDTPASKDALDALIARLSGGLECSAFIAVFGRETDRIEGASNCLGLDIQAASLPVSVFVHASEENAPDPGLPVALLKWLLTLDVRSVRQFHLSGAEWIYRRNATGERRLLFVFPGPIFPVNRGSHRRAVSMILAMVEKNIDVTAVVSSSKNRLRNATAAQLSLLATEHVHYTSPSLSPGIAMAWLTEKSLDLARRIGATQLMSSRSFAQNRLRRNSASLRECLGKMDLESFDAILVNYAWLLPSILRRGAIRPLLICDTHDVQFLRSFGKAGGKRDFIASLLATRTKRQELGLLRRADLVLSISERDQDVFAQHLRPDQTILATNSFDYVSATPRELDPSQPLRFGFIGAIMEANQLALTEILNNWWPAISEWLPESRLIVAGGIGAEDVVYRLGARDDTIEPVGFVPNLTAFYRDIDVLLSPVLLAGGLNFKNAEAISAGVTLITSPLGASALGGSDEIRTAEDANDVVRHLQDIKADADGELARRRHLQAALHARYDPGPAIDRIIEMLSSGT